MVVLGIIGLTLVALLIFWMVVVINEYSESTFDYQFFNLQNFTVACIGYAGLYFGNRWYENELAIHGDLLNGQILMGIGVLFLLWVFYINIKRTNIYLGLSVTVIQLVLYASLSVFALFALLLAAAMLMETRPVYNLNGK